MSGRSGAIGRTFAVQVVVRIVSTVASILTVTIATRYLGTDGFGLLATAIVFVGLFESFTELGMGPVIVRRVAGGTGTLSRLVGINLGFRLIFAPFVTIVTAGLGLLLYHDDPTLQLAVVIIASGLLFTTLANCWNPVYEVHLRFGAVAFADGVSRFLTLGATWAVASLDGGLLAMAAVQVIPMAVRLLVTVLTAPRLERSPAVMDRAAILDLVRESLPFTLLLVVAVLYWRVDGVLLSLLAVEDEVAVYHLALTITGALGFVSTIFCRVVYPTIAEGFATDKARFRSSVRESYAFMFVAAAPIALLGWFVAERVLTIVSTPEFAALGTTVLQLFFVSGAISFLNALLTQPLFAAGQQRFLVRISLFGLPLNIALNLVLVPQMGAAGTGVAMVVTEVVGTALSTWKLTRMGCPPLQLLHVLRVVPGLALALGTLWLLWDAPFAVPAVASAVVYAVAVLATGALPVRVIKEMLKKGPATPESTGVTL